MCDSPMALAVIGPDLDRCYRGAHRFFSRLYQLASHQRPLVARLDGRIDRLDQRPRRPGVPDEHGEKLRLAP